MDIIRQLRNKGEYDGPTAEAKSIATTSRPQTITEIIDSQIQYHEAKIADLKAAKNAISPDVERALNALAKL